MRRSNQKGFTLLELLVVVVILGVLSAIAIPQYNAYRERTEMASVTSNCRAIYRAMTIFYLERNYEYPSRPGDGNEDDLDLDGTGPEHEEFFPLTRPSMLGGMTFEIEIDQLKQSVGGDAALKATRKYVTDPSYQQFYLVMPWGKDPSVQFIIASSDQVRDVNNVLVDGGNWLDGVFVWKNGQIKYQ